LIPTSSGLILIDAAQEPYVDHVIDGIRKVGFDPREIRYLLISHGHLDHFGGVARIQQLSRARVAALDEDWQLIEAAGKDAGPWQRAAAADPARDMVIKDGDTITLGNTSLKVYKLPGHTPGSASFEFTVFDGGRRTRHSCLEDPVRAAACRAPSSSSPASTGSRRFRACRWPCPCTVG
jgi:metallo-beta-lactamase class B